MKHLKDSLNENNSKQNIARTSMEIAKNNLYKMEKIKQFLQNEYLENSGTSYLFFISAIF